MLERAGKFQEAQESWSIAWEIASQSPECEKLFGFIGQLLAFSYEMIGLSEYSLEFVRRAKDRIIASARSPLLYTQVLSACHTERFGEAQKALAEMNELSVNNLEIHGYIYYVRGVFSYLNNRIDDAIAHFRHSVGDLCDIKRDSAFLAYIYLFNCYILLDNLGEAQKYLQAAADAFIRVGPSLSPGYLKRAQAELLLRTGAFDVVRGNPSALETLNKARVMYEELGLPVAQAQCWIQLASWHIVDQREDLAIWCLENAHNLKKQFQDKMTFKKELNLAPNTKVLYATLDFPD